MLKKLFFTICLPICCWSQNPVWISAPRVSRPATTNVAQPLPITPLPTNDPSDPFDYYDGWSALHGSNGISDIATGALKFFIIDGAIYDGTNGQYRDYAWSASQPNQLTIGNFNQPEGDGGAEQLIVPHPKNCNQYYIFGVATYWSGDSGQKSLPGYASSVPVYAIYDAILGVVIARGVWYEPTPSFLGLTISNPIFTSTTTSNPINTNGDTQVTAASWAEDCSMSTASIAGSKLQLDGSRIIACKMKNNLYSIKILSDGTLRYWKRFNHSTIISASQTRAELEMVFDSVTNTFKIAFESRIGFGNVDNYCVKYFEVSQNFLTLLNNQTINVPIVGSPSTVAKPIAGIEFSPNKNLIYFTCSTNEASPLTQPVSQRVYTIDLTNATYPVNPLAIPQTRQDQIQFGSIELALDGNMYFASATGLFRLTNPNTPTAANFSTNPIIAFNYVLNLGINSQGSTFVDNKHLFGYTLPGQIDGANYSNEYLTNTECCLNAAPFDESTFTATTSGTWSQGGLSNNPFNSTSGIVRIETSLVIPAGVDITITGMTFEFAPGARVIIQEATGSILQGGKLTINNSVLTSFNGCGNSMWHGVEVWGNASYTQGSLTNSRQGRLIIQGINSRIENALYGAAARATNPTTGAVISGKFGGIIRATNSTFLNNQNDVILADYVGSGLPNVSKFTNCLFKTDNLLNIPTLQLGNHLTLKNVSGVFVLGCDFINSNMALFPTNFQGTGILATNAGFSVDRSCSVSGCPEPDDMNTFKNLTYGIFSISSNSTSTFRSDGNFFTNNQIGIAVSGTIAEQIIRNTFEVREMLGNPPTNYQAAGIYLIGSTGYKIEENTFLESNDLAITDGSANSYGIVIANSGTAENIVYRNSFSKLKIGCQSEGTNGSAPIFPNNLTNFGLVWRCNYFLDPIYKNDITSINGKIKYYQGLPNNSSLPVYQNNKNAANNHFSMHQESLPEHDFQISPSNLVQNAIVYRGCNQAFFNLDSYTNSLITLGQPLNAFSMEFCPTNYTYGTIKLKNGDGEVSMLNSNQSEELENNKVTEEEFAFLEQGIKQLEKNSKLQEILLDTLIENKNATLIELLSQYADEESLKMLAELQIGEKDVESVVSSLQNEKVKFSQDFIDLLKIKAELLKSEDYFSFFNEKGNQEYYVKRLTEIAENKEDVLTAHQASILLSFTKPLDLTYHFLEVEEGDKKSMKIPTSNTDSKIKLIVYPNPVKNKLSINLALEENETVSATIFSVLGNTMGTWELSNENNEIDVNHFQGGIYLIHVNNVQGENIQTLRFVKQ